MFGAEVGRSGENNHVNARVDNLLVCVEAYEAVLGGDLLLVFVLQIVANVFYSLGEYVTQCHYLDVVGCCQCILDGAVTATTATNEAYFELSAVDSFVGKLGYIIFSGLFQRNHFLLFVTCSEKCRCANNAAYAKY